MHHLEHNDTIRCYHCGNIVPMKLVGRDVSKWDETKECFTVTEWSFYLCPTCKRPTVVSYSWKQNETCFLSKTQRKVEYPENVLYDTSVPVSIQDAFRVAVETKSSDIVVIMIAWRRVVELICDDLHATGNNLFEQISDLGRKNLIPNTIETASHLIRKLGNESAHSDGGETLQVDARDIESLVRIIVEYVYVLPQRVSEISGQSMFEKR